MRVFQSIKDMLSQRNKLNDTMAQSETATKHFYLASEVLNLIITFTQLNYK